MPRRVTLTDRQKDALLRLPTSQTDLLKHYTLSDEDFGCQMRVFGTGVLGTRYCRVPGSWYRAEGCVGPDR